MTYVIFSIIFILLAIFVPRYFPPDFKKAYVTIPFRGFMGLLAVYCVLSTSVIKIPADQVGVVRKVIGYSNLPEGHIIATNGETGNQAEIIAPGTFRIIPFFNILNDITYMPVVKVPQGVYARVVARDGAPLRDGQIMADAWPDSKFMDAQYFMTHGGQRGLQLSVLKPGTYPINLKLFEVRIGYQPNGKDIQKHYDDVYDENGLRQEDSPLDTSITHVPAGFVGVVRSSIETPGTNCEGQKATVGDNDSLSAVLVPTNCKGIWAQALPPNDYYLNKDAYDVTLVDTRVQTLEFGGGYIKRSIDLTVGANGAFTQKERSEDVAKTGDAVDVAVGTKIEGWEIPQELRAVLQISPEHAPIIVAAVGGLKDVETKITIPSIRSNVRNVYGGTIEVIADANILDDKGNVIVKSGEKYSRPTRVLDTVEQRTALEAEILQRVKIDGKRAGVDIKEIRLGSSIIPPELLLARQREQLAQQLKQAFVQEEAAQLQRQEVTKAAATADQQTDLVKAQIGLQTAQLGQQKREAEGNGERLYLEQLAKGQQAQTAVLGADKVFMGTVIDKVMTVLAAHPEMVADQKWPQYLFVGGNDMTNGAGMVATSPALKALLNPPTGALPAK